MQSGNVHAGSGLGPANYGLSESRIANYNAQYYERNAKLIEENHRKEEEKRARKAEKKGRRKSKRMGKGDEPGSGEGKEFVGGEGGEWGQGLEDRKDGKQFVGDEGGEWGKGLGVFRGGEKGFEYGEGFAYGGEKGTSLEIGKEEKAKRSLLGFLKRGSRGGKEDEVIR
jgi:hypothetical protein